MATPDTPVTPPSDEELRQRTAKTVHELENARQFFGLMEDGTKRLFARELTEAANTRDSASGYITAHALSATKDSGYEKKENADQVMRLVAANPEGAAHVLGQPEGNGVSTAARKLIAEDLQKIGRDVSGHMMGEPQPAEMLALQTPTQTLPQERASSPASRQP